MKETGEEPSHRAGPVAEVCEQQRKAEQAEIGQQDDGKSGQSGEDRGADATQAVEIPMSRNAAGRVVPTGLVVIGHVLMLAGMAAVMLLRPAEYAGHASHSG